MGTVGLGSVTWNGAINRSARANFFPRRSIAHLDPEIIIYTKCVLHKGAVVYGESRQLAGSRH